MPSLKFYDGQGNENLLGQTDKTIMALGRKDTGTAEPDFFTAKVPRRHGVSYRGFVMKDRVITIPIVLHANDAADMEQLRDSIINSFNPITGQGTLRYERDNGTIREIKAVLDNGLTFQTSDTSDAGLPLTVTLTASDPLWYDPSLATYGVSLTTGTHLLSSPLSSPLWTTSPFQPSSFTISNSGTAPSWPEFSIQGPCQNPVITNSTTGKSIGVYGVTIPAGCSLHIATRPGTREVSLASGSYTQNLIHNPNFTAGVSGWGGYSGATVTQVIDDSPFMGITGTGKFASATCMEFYNPTNGDFSTGNVVSSVNMVIGAAYALAFYAKPVLGNSILKTSIGGTAWTSTTLTSGWNRYILSLTAGTTGVLQFTTQNPGTVRIDEVMLVKPGTDMTYIDGNQPNCTWDGVPNYSTSSRWGLFPQVMLTNLVPGSQFWSLQPGSNALQIVTTQAGGAPGLTMGYHALYIGA